MEGLLVLAIKMKNVIENVDVNNLPKHVAIIMDGNGRWAKQRGKIRIFGHRNAIKAVRSAINACNKLNIPYLTLYAFSSENWNRPKDEVNGLMKLLVSSIKKEADDLMKNNIKLLTIGETENLPKEVFEELQSIIDRTKNNTKGVLTIALSYGSKQEIIRAIKKIAIQYKEDNIKLDDINEELVKENLYTYNIPDVDLMIRTSGEYRISNFLLWQMAYSELYFTEVLWPDFEEKDFYQAINHYQNRERRFGKTTEQLT